jgi:subfamily B ATP-binding cassette protein MsbA
MTKIKITPAASSTWPLLRRLYREYVAPRIGRIMLAMLLVGIAAAMTAAQAYLLEPIINKIFVNKQSEYLVPIAVSVIAVFLLRGFANWGHAVMMAYIGQDIIGAIQTRLYRHLIRMDMAYFQQHPAGSLSALLTSDVIMMRMAMADMMTGIGKNVLTLIFLVCVMFYQDWMLSLMAFVVFPPAGFVVSKIGRRLRQVADTTQQEQGRLGGLLNQSFLGIRQVKAYAAETHEDERIGSTFDRITKLCKKSARVQSLSLPISELLAGSAIAVIVWYGGSQVIAGISTPGKFFSFIGAFIMAYEPLKRLAKMNAGIQIGLASAARVFAVLDTQATIVEKPSAVPLVVRDPTIVFDRVSFRYPDGTPALHDVSFTARAGAKTALIGPSGSGKTTCLQLLLRFYDVNAGRITIDGVDIRDVTLDSLRRATGFVSQDVFIFDDTVARNIAYADAGLATDAMIMAAAKRAAAHDFITQMEHGYETRVGEMGTKLSGGQKQRLAIARAILKDAPILMLDEATSALDTESERLVNGALDTLQKGRTTLVIAHRLSTIRDAAHIIVMESGRVAATGTHDSLITGNPLYASLYATLDITEKAGHAA